MKGVKVVRISPEAKQILKEEAKKSKINIDLLSTECILYALEEEKRIKEVKLRTMYKNL